MNTNPKAIKVLCYGDSNTWGQKPDKSGRFPVDVRWPGVLQNELGDDYYLIEEGLGSRTTDLDYDKKPGRNGITYLYPCVESHNPIDIVVLMLGTNDLKIEFNRPVDAIGDGLKKCIELIKSKAIDGNSNTPSILLVSPIHIDDTMPKFSELYTGYYDQESADKSKHLASLIKQLAIETGCKFVDASTVAHAGEDGVHFSEDSHGALGKTISRIIKSLRK